MWLIAFIISFSLIWQTHWFKHQLNRNSKEIQSTRIVFDKVERSETHKLESEFPRFYSGPNFSTCRIPSWKLQYCSRNRRFDEHFLFQIERWILSQFVETQNELSDKKTLLTRTNLCNKKWSSWISCRLKITEISENFHLFFSWKNFVFEKNLAERIDKIEIFTDLRLTLRRLTLNVESWKPAHRVCFEISQHFSCFLSARKTEFVFAKRETRETIWRIFVSKFD